MHPRQVLGQETAVNWVDFLKTAWKQMQFAWEAEAEDFSNFGSSSLSAPVGANHLRTVANRLTASAIRKSRRAHGLAIIANIEMVAINVIQ